jgi:hypothetical protein
VPLPEDAKVLEAGNLWPGSSAISGICLLCGALVISAVLFPLLLHYVRKRFLKRL